MGHERLVRLVRPMNTINRILGESVRPPMVLELTDPGWACGYAKNVLKGRFPEGEATMATDPRWSCDYAIYVLGGRFPEGEAAIATDAYWAFGYAADVLKGRFPEGEAAIAKDPIWAKEYLERFPEAKHYWVMRGWLDWFDL